MVRQDAGFAGPEANDTGNGADRNPEREQGAAKVKPELGKM